MRSFEDAVTLLGSNKLWVAQKLQVANGDLQYLIDAALTFLQGHDLHQLIKRVLEAGASTRFSFLYFCENGRALLLELVDRQDLDTRLKVLLEVAATDSLYVPFNIRAQCFAKVRSCIATIPTCGGSS